MFERLADRLSGKRLNVISFCLAAVMAADVITTIASAFI